MELASIPNISSTKSSSTTPQQSPSRKRPRESLNISPTSPIIPRKTTTFEKMKIIDGLDKKTNHSSNTNNNHTNNIISKNSNNSHELHLQLPPPTAAVPHFNGMPCESSAISILSSTSTSASSSRASSVARNGITTAGAGSNDLVDVALNEDGWTAGTISTPQYEHVVSLNFFFYL